MLCTLGNRRGVRDVTQGRNAILLAAELGLAFSAIGLANRAANQVLILSGCRDSRGHLNLSSGAGPLK